MFKRKNIIIILIICILFLSALLFFNRREGFFDTAIYTAVIIEPREHRALQFVMRNFLDNLDERWNFIIFYGNKNKKFVFDMIENIFYMDTNRIKLINLNVDNLSIEKYSKLLVSKSFYENIPTEMFLIFQADTMICSNFKNNIYKFMNYDYVGAPWDYGEVGNGGLSLRRKSKMLEIIEKCIYNNHDEDKFFSKACDGVIFNKPNFEESKKFAIEGVYSNDSFGVHKPWLYINETDRVKLNDQCEGYNKLVELNSN